MIEASTAERDRSDENQQVQSLQHYSGEGSKKDQTITEKNQALRDEVLSELEKTVNKERERELRQKADEIGQLER